MSRGFSFTGIRRRRLDLRARPAEADFRSRCSHERQAEDARGEWVAIFRLRVFVVAVWIFVRALRRRPFAVVAVMTGKRKTRAVNGSRSGGAVITVSDMRAANFD